MKNSSTTKENKWKLIETINYQKIRNACRDARDSQRMVAVMGYTGAGKTTAVTNYTKNNENTFLVTCYKGMKAKDLLGATLEALGLYAFGSSYKMTKRLIEAVNKIHNPLIIFDEISKLPHASLVPIQEMWDGISDDAGIVMVGVGYFKTKLERAVQLDRVGMPEFNSRIGYWCKLNKPSNIEMYAICEANGIMDEKTKRAFADKSMDYRYLTQIIKNNRNEKD